MKIEKVDKVTDFRYLNLFSISYRDRRDNEKQYVFASRSRSDNPLESGNKVPDAVVVVPYHVKERKLVLIEEFRVALGGYQYGFPAGLIDAGENIEQAGRRELFEETGLKVSRIIQQSPKVFSSSGMTDESVALLFVECFGSPTTRHNEASEDIRVKMVSRHQAEGMLFDEKIKYDVKSWLVLNIFSAQGFF